MKSKSWFAIVTGVRTKRQAWRAWYGILIGVLLIPVVIGVVIERALFSFKSVAVDGTVTQVTAKNERCARKGHRYNCTQFEASIAYTYRDQAYSLQRDAGSVHEHDQPLSLAYYAAGNTVPVVLNPDRPGEVRLDTFSDVWGEPLMYFILQISSLFGGLAARRQTTQLQSN
jgi:hypothetical protein